jgi:hypothetical protein
MQKKKEEKPTFRRFAQETFIKAAGNSNCTFFIFENTPLDSNLDSKCIKLSFSVGTLPYCIMPYETMVTASFKTAINI